MAEENVKIICSKCGTEAGESMFWVTKPGDKIVCKGCLPKTAKRIGLRH